VALLTDGRFSGATRGLMAGHVAPEAYVGGPIAALREGDMIVFDITNRQLHCRTDRGADQRTPRLLDSTRTALYLGGDGEICGGRLVSVRRAVTLAKW